MIWEVEMMDKDEDENGNVSFYLPTASFLRSGSFFIGVASSFSKIVFLFFHKLHTSFYRRFREQIE